MTFQNDDVIIKREHRRFRLIRDNEVTLAQAVPMLGLTATDAVRYLLRKGVPHVQAMPDTMLLSEPARCYLRSDIEAASRTVKADMAAKVAEEEARRLANMKAARQRREQQTMEAAKAPYVSLDEAARLTGRDLDDPLFDELPFITVDSPAGTGATNGWMSIVVALQPETNSERMYARDDIEPYIARSRSTATRVNDIGSAVAAYTASSNAARQWLARHGALCAA